ncbi:hypothetical protein Tco_0585050 [Tanacetum coccineum]
MHPGKSQSEHIDKFHKLVDDLVAIDTVISNEDQALLLLASLPSSYDNFMDTLLFGRDTLKLEDVLATLNYMELQKMTEAEGDSGKGLYVKGVYSQRDMKQGKGSTWNEDHVSGFRADRYDNADVMMVMSAEKLLGWIMYSGGSYHMTYMRDYLVDFEEYDGGNVLMGDGKECHVRGTGNVRVNMRDGPSFVLNNVRYVPELRRNLISPGTLEKEGFTMKMQSGRIKILKGSSKENGWEIKTTNVLNSCNHVTTQQCTKGRVAKRVGNAALQQHNGLVEETNVTLLTNVAGSQEVHTPNLLYYLSTHGMEQHSTRELFRYKEDSNEAAYALAEADKIYAHESLTFNDTIACEVISKWKVRLKEEMDAQSDVYVRTSISLYRWYGFFADAMMENGLPRVCLLKQRKMYLVWRLLGIECLSRDCDVGKNGKCSYVYVVGSHEYLVVCTRPDIASVDVDMLYGFDRGLHTYVQVFVDFEYAMGRSITVMVRSIIWYGLVIRICVGSIEAMLHHMVALLIIEAGCMTFIHAWNKDAI